MRTRQQRALISMHANTHTRMAYTVCDSRGVKVVPVTYKTGICVFVCVDTLCCYSHALTETGSCSRAGVCPSQVSGRYAGHVWFIFPGLFRQKCFSNLSHQTHSEHQTHISLFTGRTDGVYSVVNSVILQIRHISYTMRLTYCMKEIKLDNKR